MKKIALLFLLLPLLAAGCHHGMLSELKGSGKRVMEKRNVTPFTSISTEGAFSIVVTAQKDLALEVEGDSLDATVLRAAGALTECVHSRYGAGAPSPRELIEIKADNQWASSHAVDWTKAVVTMVPLRDANGSHT